MFVLALLLPTTAFLDVTSAINQYKHGKINRVVEFIYHTTELSWARARVVCQENGGDLATIETIAQVESLTHHAEKSGLNGTSFLKKDYWVGLFETDDGDYKWVFECTPLKDLTAFDLTTTGVKRNCFYRHAESFQVGESDKCFASKPFICQRYTNGPCKMDDILFAKVSFNGTAETDDSCMDMCIADTSCINSLFLASNTCFLLETTSSTTGNNIRLASKLCIKVSLNETIIDASSIDSSQVVDNNCSIPQDNTEIESFTILTNSLIQTSTLMKPSYCMPSTTTEIISSTFTLPCYSITSTATLSSEIGTSLNSSNTSNSSSRRQGIDDIVRNLTIDAKTTSAYTRRLSSAHDARTTSAVMGCLGLVLVLLPIALIVLTDMKLLYFQIRTNGLSSTKKGSDFKMKRIQLNLQ